MGKLRKEIASMPDATGSSKNRVAELEAKVAELMAELQSARSRKQLTFGSGRPSLRKGRIRVTFGDTHGMRVRQGSSGGVVPRLEGYQAARNHSRR